MKKRAWLFSLSVVIAITTFSCGIDLPPDSKENNSSIRGIVNTYNNNLVVEVSKQKGAEVTVNIQTIIKEPFSVKVSGSGTPKGVLADINHIKLVISNNPMDPYNNPVHVSAVVSIGPIPSVAANNSVTFKGLIPNKNYYIAARAFKDAAETNNITQGGTAYSTENVTVNSTGQISINNDDADSIWDLTVPLLDQAGAGIDTVINAKNGTLGNFSVNPFPINTTTGNQTNPDVSVNKYGNGLVVWEDPRDTLPNPHQGLYARFIKDFLPDGNEFKADQNVTNGVAVINPSVYLNDIGNGFITWSVGSPAKINYRHIVNYKPQGTDTELNSASSDNQDNSKISLGTDRGIVVWENGLQIKAKGIKSDNNFNTSTFSTASSPVTADSSQGNVLDLLDFESVTEGSLPSGWTAVNVIPNLPDPSKVTWQVNNNTAASGTKSIYFGNLTTDTYEVTDQRVAGDLLSPKLDLTGKTGNVLTFKDTFSTETQSIGYDKGKVFISGNNGADWTEITNSIFPTVGGSVSYQPWTSHSYTIPAIYDNNPDVRFKFVFDTSDQNYNNFPGWNIDDIKIESFGTNEYPDVSKVNSNGDCLAVWQRTGNIIARKITVQNDAPVTVNLDTAFQINQNANTNIKPSVSLNDTGDGLVVWQVNNDIVGRRIVNYKPNGPEFVIENNGSNQVNPRVVLNPTGNGSVVWQDSRDGNEEIYGVSIIKYNVVKDTYRLINPAAPTANAQSVPAISMNENLKGIVVWQDEISAGDFDISGRRMVDLLPQ